MTTQEYRGIGLLYRQTDVAMPVVDLALAAEHRRYDTMVLAEHTHIPGVA